MDVLGSLFFMYTLAGHSLRPFLGTPLAWCGACWLSDVLVHLEARVYEHSKPFTIHGLLLFLRLHEYSRYFCIEMQSTILRWKFAYLLSLSNIMFYIFFISKLIKNIVSRNSGSLLYEWRDTAWKLSPGLLHSVLWRSLHIFYGHVLFILWHLWCSAGLGWAFRILI